VLEWGYAVRDAIAKKRIRRIMSTRRLIAMTQQKQAGMAMKKIKDRYFASWSKDERSKVDNV